MPNNIKKYNLNFKISIIIIKQKIHWCLIINKQWLYLFILNFDFNDKTISTQRCKLFDEFTSCKIYVFEDLSSMWSHNKYLARIFSLRWDKMLDLDAVGIGKMIFFSYIYKGQV